VIKNLRPATKYFVTVAAGTSGGYGPNSAEISKITSGGKTNQIKFVEANLLQQYTAWFEIKDITFF
jgi:hypothetical protein